MSAVNTPDAQVPDPPNNGAGEPAGVALARSAAVLAPRLAAAAAADPALREALVDVLRGLLAQLDAGPTTDSQPARPRAEIDPAALTSPASEAEERFFRVPVAEASPLPHPAPTRGPAAGDAPSPQAPTHIADDELPLIAKRCRLKAQGSRWAAERMRLLADGADYRSDIDPRDSDIIERARALGQCFLWMCHADAPSPEDGRTWEVLAGCFDALADALDLVHKLLSAGDERRDLLESAADLLAEAQSAVRIAVASVQSRPDADQDLTFKWLTRFTSERGIYLRRFMRLDDPAAPANRHDLARRVDALDQQWQTLHRAQVKRRSTIRQVRYHLEILADGRSIDPSHDWGKVVETVDEAVRDGRPPSDPELRELLLPVLDAMPPVDSPPQHFARVMREIDRFLESRPAADPDSKKQTHSADVERVRQLLGGTTLVLIGGCRRPQSQRNLEEAFDLKELRWVSTTPHQSLDEFEPHIANAGVAVVLLAIRWTSHSFGGVKEICDRHGKCLVRLPAGYGVNTVASEVLRQCSDELERRVR